MTILDQSSAGLGVHLDKNGKPFAEIQAGNDWSITASHELLEMLVDPLGHKLIRDPDIDPASDGHQVEYLVEVGDPCEVFAYPINGIRSEEHTSELQSHSDLVCRLLLEKKKKNDRQHDD